jgi:Domain of unknown function (DUF4157)
MTKTPANNFEKAPARLKDARKVEAPLPEACAHETVARSIQSGAGNQAMANLMSGSGRPLDAGTREEMEQQFSEDFSDVKIHNDGAGSDAAVAAGARAVTSGRDVAFARGFFAPETSKGRLLLAHELAHVVQQGRGAGSSRDAAETDAKQAAMQVAGGENATVTAAGSGGAQADSLTDEELQQMIAENEAKAEKATSQQEIDQLWAERESLRTQLEMEPSRIQVPGGPVQPAAPPNAFVPPSRIRPVIRTDYPADENAYHGMDMAYTVENLDKDVYAKGVSKSKRYWFAPHFRPGTENVVYYAAYNPTQKRIEYIVGPGEIEQFKKMEDILWVGAAGAYPLVGEPSEYQAETGKMAANALRGDVGGMFRAFGRSWTAAVKDPGFYIQAVPATAGVFAGPAAPVAGEVETISGNVANESATLAGKTSVVEPPTAVVEPDAPNVSTLEAPAEPSVSIPESSPEPSVSTLESPIEPNVSTLESSPELNASTLESSPEPNVSTLESPAEPNVSTLESPAEVTDVSTPEPTPEANASTFDPQAEPRLTSTEQTFSEVNTELQSVSPAEGELQGTSPKPMEFESPTPLQLPEGEPLIEVDGVPVRESAGAAERGGTFQSASAQTPRSMNTAIRADLGESEAYKAALKNGEIGLQRPGGANVPGADFITAAEGPEGMEVIVNDAKTSSVGKFPAPKGPGVKAAWQVEVDDAIARMDLGDPVLEARIREAYEAGNVWLRQLNVNYSPAGGGAITGF